MNEKLAVSGLAALGTLVLYYAFFGKKHQDERTQLSVDLEQVCS
jgi:hypothetical protein